MQNEQPQDPSPPRVAVAPVPKPVLSQMASVALLVILLLLAAFVLMLSPPFSQARADTGTLVGRLSAMIQPRKARFTAEASPTQVGMANSPTSAEPPLLRLQNLTPAQALMTNASVPISTASNPAARPFVLKSRSVLDAPRALDCLTAAVYYEAALESADGQAAVAQVVLNRLRHPTYPKTVCGVVFEGQARKTGCQFTFSCDGALKRRPDPILWAQARDVADKALKGKVMKAVGNSTHYHTVWVVPYWSPGLVKTANIGAHIFYRWTGGSGRPGAFGGQYAGGESTIAGLDVAVSALPVKASAPLTAVAAPAIAQEQVSLQVAPLQLVDLDMAPIQASPLDQPLEARPATGRLAVPGNW